MDDFQHSGFSTSPHSTVVPIEPETRSLLQHLTQAVSDAPSFEAALTQVLQQVCQSTQWCFGEAWVPTPEGHRLKHSGLWYTCDPLLHPFAKNSQDLMLAPGEGLPGRVWASQQPEWQPDVSNLSATQFPRLELALSLNLRAALAVPIQMEGKTLAVLVFLTNQAWSVNPSQIQWVSAIATQLGAIMGLKQAEARLVAHQQWLSQLIDALPGIVFTTQGPPNWEMNYLSRGCVALTGYTSEALTGPLLDDHHRYQDLLLPGEWPRVKATIEQAIATRQPYVVEYQLQTRTGDIKWVWEQGHGLWDAAGQVQGLEGFITDISELKRTEAALRESEARYRSLAEQSQDLISQHSLSGICSYVSPACQSLLGYAPEALLGHNLIELLHPGDRRRLWRAYRRLRQQQTSQTFCFRLRHKSGHYRWFEASSCIIQPTATADQEILAVSRDITERVQAEQTLRDRERFLQLILDNIPQHLFWKDDRGVYLGCNQAFAEWLGLASAAEILGKTDADLPPFTREDAEYFRSRDRIVMSRNQPDLHVIEGQLHIDGSRRWISCSKLPIHDSQDAVIGVLGTFEDISDRLAAQQALARREQYLSALVEVQRRLLTLDDSWDRDRYLQLLEPLGRAAGASRASIYEVDLQSGIAYPKAQWCADESPPAATDPAAATLTIQPTFDPWITALNQGQVINQVADQFTPAQRALLSAAPWHLQSVLLLPLFVKGRLHGVIGFGNCTAPRTWTRSEVALLQVAASATALAIERWQAETSLRQAEAKYRSIFENAVEGIFQTTLSGQYLTANPMLARLYGYDSPAELMSDITDIGRQLYVDPGRRQIFIQEMLQQGAVLGFESQVYRRDGSIVWISESARVVRDEQGQVVGFEGTVEDITARKRAETELHRRDRLLQGVTQASQQLLTAADFQAALPQVLKILGQAAAVDRVYIYENHPHPQTGEPAMSVRHEWTEADVPTSLEQPHWQNRPYRDGLMRWYQAFLAGQSLCERVQALPAAERSLLQAKGVKSILMVPIFLDQELWGSIGFDDCRRERQWTQHEESILVAIAASLGGALKRQQAEHQMRHQAFHDTLTGLPNRTLFNQHLPLAIAHAQRAGEMMAVLFLDLDRFKIINDTLGHAVGDQLLQQATQRLTEALREQDVIARWGGDEFTLILPNLTSPEDAAKVAQRLASVLKPSFLIEGQELYITSSIGIALYPQDGRDMTTLLQHADAAMYQAKAEGRNTYRFYTTQLNSSASHLLTLEKYLHRALERDELRLFFQPQVDVATGRILQVEALLRWQAPHLGCLSPKQFIPVAEEIGLIVAFGDWVLEQACQQLYRWHQAGFTPLRMAVNLSSRQLQQRHFAANIAEQLARYNLSPACLELEITEMGMLLDLETSVATLQDLQALGARVIMDDFGTGYSSLSYLKQFPLQGLKIDRTFVQGIPDDRQDVAMLRAVMALSQELQLDVVAEGVETAAQEACLQSLGCTQMQGYRFSQPLQAADMTDFLQRHWYSYDQPRD